MFQKNMQDYFTVKITHIIYNYYLALNKNDVDGVHDLRVELKRLRAFFNLAESINPDFNVKKNFRNFRKIAKNTSGIRDSQVQRKLLKKMEKSLHVTAKEFETFLKNREAQGVEQFKNFAQQFVLHKLVYCSKTIVKAMKTVSPVVAETKVKGRFYNLRNNLVRLSSEENLNDDTLHDVRIHSKELHYTLEAIQQCFMFFEDNKDFVVSIKKVHQALGKWHDYDIALALLNDFRNGSGEKPLNEPYDTIIGHIHAEKDVLNNKFRAVLDEFAETAVLI